MAQEYNTGLYNRIAMPFDRRPARSLTLDDRGIAPYFAGRKREIESFMDALAAAARKDQAVFRIFQGAPDCGKTSLAARRDPIRGVHERDP